MDQSRPAVIPDKTLEAITYSFTEEEKADIQSQVQIYNERIGRFDVGYGESRLTPEKAPEALESLTVAFDKFLGSGSTDAGVPRTASLITRGSDGKSYYSRISFADAYTQTSPGVFVRKESATAVDALYSRPIDEAKQFFPKVIDVSKLTNSATVKPYVDSGLVKTPKATTTSTPEGAQNYFFRNSAVPSMNNRDITERRTATLTPIAAPTNLLSSQPIIDFRASERASLGTLGASTTIKTFAPIAVKQPQGLGVGSPAIQGVSGDSLLERRNVLAGLGTTPATTPTVAPIGRIGGR
jgi:hypothetical protein